MNGDTDARAPRMAQASRWLLALGIAGSALAVGTVHTITLCVVTAVLAAAAVLGWWRAEPMRARSQATLLLVAGIGLTTYTALQCVPMPVGWLAVIAPHNADVWSRALAPLHEAGPRWAPISLDPFATRIEVLKGVAYLLAYVTALRVARRKNGIRFLGFVIVATGLAMALAAVLHPTFGATRLFGLYEPGAGISERHIAPLMNPNNLAGYLTLAFCLSLATLLAPEADVPRPLSGVVTVLLVGAQLWVASRGGVVTMALGAALVFALSRAKRSRHSAAPSPVALVTGAVLVTGTVLFVLAGSDEASSELLDSDVSKIRMSLAMTRSLSAMPFFGCGRGAFESAYPAFRVSPGFWTFTHPENVVVQWLVEWGLPVGIAGLAAVALALRPRVVLARSDTALGAWAGLVAVAVQNLADLGTEIPGLMMACVACVGVVVAGTPGNEPRWAIGRWAQRPRGVAVAAGLLATSILVLGTLVLGRELHDDQKAVLRVGRQPDSPVAEMRAIAREAMLRHPSEPYFPFVAAVRAEARRDDDPMPWIEATLERAPIYGPAHLLVGHLLGPRSPSQARLEYRVAMEQAPNLIVNVMAEAPRVVGSYADATEVLPSGKEHVTVGELLVQAIDERLPATQVRIDADLAARAPMSYGPARRSARNAVLDLEAGGAPWCQGMEREACVNAALKVATRLQEMDSEKCDGYLWHARARIADGDTSGGLGELEAAANRLSDRRGCTAPLVALAIAAGDAPRAERVLERAVRSGCADTTACLETLRWAAPQYEALGRPQKALALYRQAIEQSPDDNLLAHTAQLAAANGLHAEAAAFYAELARRLPQNPTWQRFATQEHDAAMRATVGL